MTRILMMQIILLVALFFGGIHVGMVLSQVFRAQKTWWWLLPPAFGSASMFGLLLFSIIRPDGFGG
jgi:uncharacterized membrane protein